MTRLDELRQHGLGVWAPRENHYFHGGRESKQNEAPSTTDREALVLTPTTHTIVRYRLRFPDTFNRRHSHKDS